MSAANWFELVQSTAFVALMIWVVIDTRRRGELGPAGLLTIAGFSIFWQEFYADWGAYLLWSPDFHMLPWGSTTWTTPDKPAMNIVGRGSPTTGPAAGRPNIENAKGGVVPSGRHSP